MGFTFFTQKKVTKPLYLRNTLSGAREQFEAGRIPVRMYSCGPTVYDFVHIGNLRSFVFADILKRTFIYNGYDVEHTMNFTDFGHLVGDGDGGEDKMMVALRREKKPVSIPSMLEVAEVYIEAFMKDREALNLLPPTHITRASEYLKEEIALIEVLVEKGYTYETEDGIYFDISRFPSYGKLGNIDLAKLKEGARVEVNTKKKHPADFVLWKKGELGWESTWGRGFPGWHIECTAMAFATLGKQFDIHTGGIDLAPTHHNGEIAQAEAATGKHPYVRFWLHNEFINIEHKKISKSLGNTISLPQLIDRGFPALSYRYWLLTGHYRSPMNFTFEALEGAKQALYRLERFVFERAREGEGHVITHYQARFHEAINDDLDTPKALAVLWEVAKDQRSSEADRIATIKDMDRVFGFSLDRASKEGARVLGIVSVEDLPQDVQKLVEEREAARAKKAWDEADALRQAINVKGFLIEDTAQGTKITRAR